MANSPVKVQLVSTVVVPKQIFFTPLVGSDGGSSVLSPDEKLVRSDLE